MVKYNAQALDATFGALSDPTRRSILGRLAKGELTVTELAEPYDISMAAVSKHLRVLTKAGLVAQDKQGRIRRCRLKAEPLEEAATWIARYRRFWEERFDALEEYLNQTTTKEEQQWPPHNQSKTPRSRSGAPSTRRERRSSKRGPTRKR